MKRYLLHLSLIFVIFFFISCDKDSFPDPLPNLGNDPVESDEALSDTVVTIMDTIPSLEIGIEDIILYNGMSVMDALEKYDPSFLKDYPSGRVASVMEDLTPEEKKIMLNAKMLAVGAHFVDDKEHHISKAGENEPEQFGLGYVLGSKSIDKRGSAKENGTGECTEKLYGIDCSGFVSKMLAVAGIRNIDGTSAQADVAKWNDALKKAPKSLSGVKAKHYSSTEMPASKLQAGDFIYWKNKKDRISHSGMVLMPVGKSGVLIYQSNGAGSPTPKKACSTNYNSKPVPMESKRRGPRVMKITEIESAFGSELKFAGAIRLEFDEVKITPEITNGELDVEYTFTAESDSKPEDYIYEWDFGDGTPVVTKSKENTVNHTYTKAGSFNITAVLKDKAGKVIAEGKAKVIIKEHELYTFSKISGDNQAALINKDIPNPLVVKVVDQNGKGVANIHTTIQVKNESGSVDNTTKVTDAEGLVDVRWKAGDTEGIHIVEINAKDKDGNLINGSPLVFTAFVSKVEGDWVFYDAEFNEGNGCINAPPGSSGYGLRASLKIKKEYTEMVESFWFKHRVTNLSNVNYSADAQANSVQVTWLKNYFSKPVWSDGVYNYYKNFDLGFNGCIVDGKTGFEGGIAHTTVYIPGVATSNEVSLAFP